MSDSDFEEEYKPKTQEEIRAEKIAAAQEFFSKQNNAGPSKKIVKKVPTTSTPGLGFETTVINTTNTSSPITPIGSDVASSCLEGVAGCITGINGGRKKNKFKKTRKTKRLKTIKRRRVTKKNRRYKKST